MFTELTEIITKPKLYEHANTPDQWNTPHIAKQMLKFHLDPNHDAASRNKACDFCALSPANRNLFLKKVFDSLKDEGYFVLDVV